MLKSIQIISLIIILIIIPSCNVQEIEDCSEKYLKELKKINNNPGSDFDNDGIINKIDNCHFSNTQYSIDNKGCINLDSLLPKRNLNKKLLESNFLDSSCETGVFIVYGQSNAANSGECGNENKSNNSFQFFQGETYKLNNTMIGSTGYKCNPWNNLAIKLIENNLFKNVIFANCAVGGSSLENLISGPNFSYFEENLKNLLLRYGKVDGILFHQGEANHSNVLGHNNYKNDFDKFYNKIQVIYPDTKFYLSRASYCKNYSDKDLISIQNSLINYYDNVYAGPNTDDLIEYRIDDCHFSVEGLRKFSNMFFELIKTPVNFVQNG